MTDTGVDYATNFMNLRLRYFPVQAIRLGEHTALTGTTLTASLPELRTLLLADKRLGGVTIDVAAPGDSTRIINVQDVIQPRTKVAGPGTVFPGFLGNGRTVGAGITHCLSGMAILSCGEIADKASAEGPSSNTGPRDRILDMSGPAAALSPFSSTVNLVLWYHQGAGVSPVEFDAAMRLGSLKAANYLARASQSAAPAYEEVWDLTPTPGLPNLVYIVHVHNNGLLRDTYLYGQATTNFTVPTILHPCELQDGAVVNASLSHAAVSTYAFQDNQVARGMWKRHGREANFAGVVVTNRHHWNDSDKEQRAWFSAKLARQLGADGVVITQEGGGNSIIDQMLTCQTCEALGIRTSLVSYEMGGADGTDFPLIYFVPEAKAIASTGNREVVVPLPRVQKALGGEKFLFPEAPAAGEYSTHVTDICFAIDLSGFHRLRGHGY